ncbi:MAG: DUF465 domain-containing protein [Micavibrio sp.]|mgnify:CR=1 FL=1|nr:DUF465 domain-containing protein [Micavibrio sp.]|tara:strand:+ start:1439 stop:1618 length:180 start_codon:yes stop_codon:yes gene_type:complete
MASRARNINPTKVRALKDKHAALEDRINDALKSPSTADYYLKQLKKQKLALKDSIERLS